MIKSEREKNFVARTWQVLSPVFLLVFLFVGCATLFETTEGLFGRKTLVRDFTSENVPKGYVEFYESKSNLPCEFDVYCLLPSEQKKEWRWVGSLGTGLFGIYENLRFAAEPGFHTFKVELGTAKQIRKIKLLEGRITPVEITALETHTIGRTYFFTTNLKVHSPVPLENPNFEYTIPPIPLPQYFNNVGCRPSLKRPGIFAKPTDSGKVIVDEDSIDFQGKKENIHIMFTEVKRIFFGRVSILSGCQVRVEYEKGGKTLYALFAGNATRIFWAIQYGLEKKGLSPIIEDQRSR